MAKPKTLFHGSNSEIETGFLESSKPNDKASKSNSQNGVYATDIFDCAKGMSLTGEQWAFVKDYTEKDFKVIFVDEPPTPKKKRFVYEVSSETFKEDPKGSHQWVSKEKVKILNITKYSTEDLKQYWRMATKEEKEEHKRLHNKK